MGSVHTINVSDRIAIGGVSKPLPKKIWAKGRHGTLLLLIPIVFVDSRFEEHPIGLILGFDEYSRLILEKIEQVTLATDHLP